MNLDIPAVRHIFQIDSDMDVKYYLASKIILILLLRLRPITTLNCCHIFK